MMILMMFMIAALRLPIIVKGTTAPSGTGTSSDPYLISSVANLEWMRDEVNDGTTGVDLIGKYFKQTSNLDLVNISNWIPIGTSTNNFVGNYDGNGYVIDHLTQSSSSIGAGLFGYLVSQNVSTVWFRTQIKNLGITNAYITNTNSNDSGILAAYINSADILIKNVFTTGTITATSSSSTGGIVGMFNAGGIIENSYSSAIISGGNIVGGIVGYMAGQGSITDSFYAGIPSSGNAITASGNWVGYITGYNSSSTSSINKVYYVTSGTLIDGVKGTTPNGSYGQILLAELLNPINFTTNPIFTSAWDSSKWQFVDGSLPNLIPPSNNANLSSITFSTGIINFAQNTTSYSFSVANSINSITMTPTVTESHATIKVNGTSVSSGSASGSISLNTGVNSITVVVTAQDNSTTKTYTITVNRGSETHLSSFLFKTALVTTNTDAISTCSDTSYVTNCTVDLSAFSSYDIEDHDYIIVTPTVIDSEATITQMSNIAQATLISNGMPTSQINLSDSPSQTITFYVTSSNGQSGRTYNLTITRPLYTVSTLSNLALSTGTLSFNPQVQTYNLTVPNTITAMSLTPTLTKSLSTMSVNGVTNANATASTTTSLVEGLNTFNVLVTAEDGITTQTYTVNVTREVPIVVPTINTATSVLSSNEQLPNTGVGSGLFGLVPLGLAMLSLTRRRMSK